jgi:hypothetical protein
VPQIVVVVMRTSASSAPTGGTGLSSRTILPRSTNTAAFMVGMLEGVRDSCREPLLQPRSGRQR